MAETNFDLFFTLVAFTQLKGIVKLGGSRNENPVTSCVYTYMYFPEYFTGQHKTAIYI
jgi:hypothetical protein